MRKATESIEEPKQSMEDKLDEIIGYLHRLERRDRARMIGSYIHGMVWLAFTLFIIWSTWYFVAHMPQMIEQMTNQMIQGSMGGGAESQDTQSLVEQLQQYLNGQQ